MYLNKSLSQLLFYLLIHCICLQCFDTVHWASWSASSL